MLGLGSRAVGQYYEMNGSTSPAPLRWDVVVFRTRDTYDRQELLYSDPPVIARVDLGFELFIERLDGQVAGRISRQCSAGGIGSSVAQRYSFVRWFEAGNDPGDFDEDERLQIAIGLSRLVRPTSVGLEESAQVWGSLTDAESFIIRPGPITGPASEAYVADRSRADWLTPVDAEELRMLLDRYYRVGVPGRVRRGLWHHEFAARALDIAARWTSVVTGLEALFNTDSEFVSRQFRERCAAVAAELGIPLTAREAGGAYGQRSLLSHGTVTRVDQGTLEQYCAIEHLLRETLRRAIEDDNWRARFESDDAVRAAWPVERPNICPTCQKPLDARS